MRKIQTKSILIAFIIYLVTCSAAHLASLHLGTGAGLRFIIACFMLVVIGHLIVAAYVRIFPLPLGEVPEPSLRYDVYHLLMFFFVNPFCYSRLIPVPLSRLYYKLLGANIGSNTYSAGLIQDAHLVSIGSNSFVGVNALICPHNNLGNRVEHRRINIGDNVVIGAHSIIMPGVFISDYAVVGMNSVVTAGTWIRHGEVWVGSPARCLKKRVDAAPFCEVLK